MAPVLQQRGKMQEKTSVRKKILIQGFEHCAAQRLKSLAKLLRCISPLVSDSSYSLFFLSHSFSFLFNTELQRMLGERKSADLSLQLLSASWELARCMQVFLQLPIS